MQGFATNAESLKLQVVSATFLVILDMPQEPSEDCDSFNSLSPKPSELSRCQWACLAINWLLFPLRYKNEKPLNTVSLIWVFSSFLIQNLHVLIAKLVLTSTTVTLSKNDRCYVTSVTKIH